MYSQFMMHGQKNIKACLCKYTGEMEVRSRVQKFPAWPTS